MRNLRATAGVLAVIRTCLETFTEDVTFTVVGKSSTGVFAIRRRD